MSSETPSFPSVLLWDEQGLQHFEAITHSKDYYLTNCEIDLLQKHSNEIVNQIEPGSVILELGSGCLRKTMILLDAIEAVRRPVDYYALDLSRPELERTLTHIRPSSYEYVRFHGLWGTYDDGKQWLSRRENTMRSKCILSLGSTIGSASHLEAAAFLRGFANAVRSTPLWLTTLFVVGVDGCKHGPTVWKAYNDLDGCNRRFILNVLHHANKVVGQEIFHPNDWTVHGEWNKMLGRHEQYLVANRDIYVESEAIWFREGQRLNVVNSHKYNPAEQSELWHGAGLQFEDCWTTKPHHYSLNVLSTRSSKVSQQAPLLPRPKLNIWLPTSH